MKLGAFEIPEFRLAPNCVQDIKKIYDACKFEKITSKDLAKLLGYSNATSGRFYTRLKSLTAYGLISGGGSNQVSQLGYQIAYPESPDHEDASRKKAIFNVELWRQLYRLVGRSPSQENFWLQLKNAAGIDAPEAQQNANLVRKWYMEDISLVPDNVLQSEDVDNDTLSTSSKSLSSNKSNNKPVSQQLVSPTDPNAFGILSVKGIGNIDLTDADSIDLAESALKILRKKLPSLTSKSNNTEQPEE